MASKTVDNYAGEALVKFLKDTTEEISTSAVMNRALIDKISTETINSKVNGQYNAIEYSMDKINPRFNEKSKHYDVIKKEILDVLTDYEDTLKSYSDKFDSELEDLILKRVQLESDLIGKIFTTEEFETDETKEEDKKKNDKLKYTLDDNSKKIVKRLSECKKDNKFNWAELSELQDNLDLEKEQDIKLNKAIDKIKEKNENNTTEIKKIEKDIDELNKEISDKTEKKKESIEEAMEQSGWISVDNKEQNIFSRITKFFAHRLNTRKAINEEVIEPLRNRISEFKLDIA